MPRPGLPGGICRSGTGRGRRSTTGSGAGRATAPWPMLVTRVRVIADAVEELDREVSVDSSIVRAHQHAAGARRQRHCCTRGGRTDPVRGQTEPVDHAIGRSRGGPTTKIHLACDGHGRPLSVVLTGGQRQRLHHVRPGPGRDLDAADLDPGRAWDPTPPSTRGQGLQHPGDPRAPAPTRHHRDHPRTRATSKPTAPRGRAGGRPPAFDRVAYRRRNVVERCFNRLKQYRAIATRYDKTATSYQGMIDLATLVMWL